MDVRDLPRPAHSHGKDVLKCTLVPVAEGETELGRLCAAFTHRKRVEIPNPALYCLVHTSRPSVLQPGGNTALLCPSSCPCPGCPSQRDTSSCTASSLRPARISKLFFLLSLTPSFSKFNSEQPAAFSLTGLLWLIICVRIN